VVLLSGVATTAVSIAAAEVARARGAIRNRYASWQRCIV
jgi:hypothetical protein